MRIIFTNSQISLSSKIIFSNASLSSISISAAKWSYNCSRKRRESRGPPATLHFTRASEMPKEIKAKNSQDNPLHFIDEQTEAQREKAASSFWLKFVSTKICARIQTRKLCSTSPSSLETLLDLCCLPSLLRHPKSSYPRGNRPGNSLYLITWNG